MGVARVFLMAAVLGLAAGRPARVAAQPAAAPFVVNWTLDEHDATSVDGLCFSSPSGKCTLRAAVQQANATAGPDTILLGAGSYVLDQIGSDDTSVAGDLDITGDLTIRGLGLNSTIIVMEGDTTNERVLTVLSGRVRLEALGLTGGQPSTHGGGIRNEANLTLDHVAVFSNTLFVDGNTFGAGIVNFGHLTLFQSLVHHNRGEGSGSGIYNTAWLTLTQSTIAYNTTLAAGAGLYNDESAWIEASTLAHNQAVEGRGGGIDNGAILFLLNSTLSSNVSATGGSALHNRATGITNAYNVTLAYNQANTDDDDAHSAGITNVSGGVVNLHNSVMVRNFDLSLALPYYDDCDGLIGIYGYVYLMPLGLYNADPVEDPCSFSVDTFSNYYLTMKLSDVGPLAENGGPTQTHDLPLTSPAFEGADPVFGCQGPLGLLATDQRGVPRVAGVRCDAGAVEHGALWRLLTPLVTR